MISVLLWIVGCYVLAAIVVYVCSAFRLGRERNVKHYVLIAGNEEPRMEWYMRSLRRFSHLTGTDVKVTVVDNGSQDDTLQIARAFAKQGMNVQVHGGSRLPADAEGRPASAAKAGEGADSAAGPPARGGEEAITGIGRSGKWKRFRRDAKPVGKDGKPFEPTHLLWMLQAEGIVSAKEHAVLIDLRDPADLSKLPF
ncbi:Glycosyl transferase family 2 [Paenibacillus sp. UNC496MF]|nr:glycosyltransferase family A protein [Paenibacillus sp. UNC496MF]SFJ26653.1 Glycosyl transferase family 2 [Paenibacillus sp. UNC496MF]